jgi:hypothetical protein
LNAVGPFGAFHLLAHAEPFALRFVPFMLPPAPLAGRRMSGLWPQALLAGL